MFSALLTGFAILSAGWALPFHVYPDGHIERTVQAIVRDDVLYIEYSVGMNDRTMRQVLDYWNKVSSDTTASEGNSKFLLRTLDSSPQSASSQSSPATSSDAETEFKNDAELLAEFQKQARQRLPGNLYITANQTKISLDPPSETSATRRHMSLTLRFNVELPDSKTIDLSIVDQNFSQSTGDIRLALKATGNLMLPRSNVSPILIRADPVSLGDLNPNQHQQARTITGKIIRP